MSDPDPSRESYERRYSAYANMGFELRDSSCSDDSGGVSDEAHEGNEKGFLEIS